MLPRHLYVHVPFCARRCAYCDFSIAVRRTTPVDEYLRAVERELALVITDHEVADPGAWELDTLYLGGGTPSQLGGGIPRLLETISSYAVLAPDAEVTIEANPEDVTRANVESWRRVGVNRISLGSQSFDPAVLQWMHRVHSAQQIPIAVATARDAGFDNISLDLIFALPRSLNRDWQRDLDSVVALAPEHISLYGLTIEPRTPLARWRDRGDVDEACEDSYAAQFLTAHDSLSRAGYDHYEVSNFAKPGRQSRHNSSYWSGASYLGIGPSAHSFDGARRWWNVAPYAEWRELLEAEKSPIAEVEVLDEGNIANERVYLGLRTNAGVQLEHDELVGLQPWVERGWAAFSSRGGFAEGNPGASEGSAPHERVSGTRNSSGAPSLDATAIEMGTTGTADRTLTLTPHGWLLLDELAASLTHLRSRSYV